MGNIKVLLVAGTFEVNKCLKTILDKDYDIEIVAEANNAYTARDKIIECNPDVMILCNDLPGMPGIVFLKKLMPQRPVSTIVIAKKECEDAAYNSGAKDFIVCGKSKFEFEKENICRRIKRLAGTCWVTEKKKEQISISELAKGNHTIIAMGASTGGTEAIARVIRDFKRDWPGVVMVLHMPGGYTHMYAQRLDNESEVTVKEAKSGDMVKPGQVLIAPGDKQMRIVKINNIYQVECRVGPKVSGHCPSVDVLFESVARVAGKNAIGVLMTGMGSDGANGLLAMKKAGARTIGQDEKTCVVYGMPKVAYEIGAVEWQVPLEQIAQKVYYLLENKS